LVVHPSPPWNYRNRTQLKVQHAPEFGLGYYRFSSHALLPVEQCPISSPLINRAIGALWQSGRDGKLAGVTEIELFADADDTQLLVSLYGADNAFDLAALRSTLPEAAGMIGFRAAPTRRPEAEPGRMSSLGSEFLTYATRHAAYRVSAGSFFQVNRHLADEL